MRSQRRAQVAAMTELRSIALCADDFALHPLVDEAVEQLSLQGRLSATSCMTTAPRWRQAAVRLPALRPQLSLGLHFNLTEGHGQQASTSIAAVIARAYTGRCPVQGMRQLWMQQLDAFEDALGTPPDFVDGHQHVHQLPGVRAALQQVLSERYSPQHMPWVRSTVPAGQLWRQAKASVIAALGGWRSTAQLRRMDVVQNQGFAGVYGFDADSPQAYGLHMQQWLAQMQQGSLMMCHPATAPVPDDAIGRQRAVEFAYLQSAEFGQALQQAGLQVAQGPLATCFLARPGA